MLQDSGTESGFFNKETLLLDIEYFLKMLTGATVYYICHNKNDIWLKKDYCEHLYYSLLHL